MLPIAANSKKIWESMRWMVSYSTYELSAYKTTSALNLLSTWQSLATETVAKIVTSVFVVTRLLVTFVVLG
jgi:hypothetical protein